jgi:hypothetical protein
MSFRLLRSICRLGTLAWFVGALLVGAALLAKHVVALPAPSADEHFARMLARLRRVEDGDKWFAIHVLFAECRCSQRIAAHLLASARPGFLHELVLWTGSEAPSSELSARFRVQRVTPAELARLGISAAPLMIIVDPKDHVRYVGGYSERKQGPALDDLQILASAREGRTVAVRPVFGCAVNERLQRQLSLFTGL